MSRLTNPLNSLRRLSEHLEFSSVGKWVGISSLIGFAGGLAAVGFEWLLHYARHYGLEYAAGLEGEGLGTGGGINWVILLALPLGGLLVGWLIERFAAEAEGHGTEKLIDTFHNKGGVVRVRAPIVKAITSAITIGSGGSAGQEGPVAQVGGGIGSGIAHLLHLSARDKRIFLLAGSSAGIGALFTAPLGGALFIPEVLYRKPEFEGEAIVPCIISSIVAYTTFTTITGRERAIEIPEEILATLSFGSPAELLFYLVLAILCAIVGWIHVRVFDTIHDVFQSESRAVRIVRPAVGAFCLALLAIAIAPWCGEHGVLFGGYELMKGAIGGQIAISSMLILIGAKILGTAFSIGSGGSGGVFAPSLAIGALLGAVVGQTSAMMFPTLDLPVAAYALVGMGGFFAGVAKTPIASILIVCEMTGGYGLLAPLMFVSVMHLLLARNWTIYDTQVGSPVDSPAHTGDFVVDILERMRVRELLDGARRPTLVQQDSTLRKALEVVSTSAGTYFPVVDEENRLVGIFSLSDVRRLFHETEVADLVIVRDFMVEDVVTMQPDMKLSEANALLTEHGLNEIPVVAIDDPTRVLCMLSRNNLGAAYHRRMHALRGVER